MITDKFIQVSEYLENLCSEQNLHILVCDFDGFTLNYHEYLPQSFGAICKYCELMLSKEKSSTLCTRDQLELLNLCKNREMFSRICYAGVEALVMPIFYQNKLLGYISVNGYRTDDEQALPRIDYMSKECSFSKKQLKDYYYKYLNPNPPTIERLQISIRIAARMLELIYKEMIDNNLLNEHVVNRENICKKIQNYIEINYMYEIDNNVLCKFFHCSHSYITHTFKKDCGMNVKSYLNLIRVEKAKEQLENSKIPIGNVASNVGFTNSTYFAKVFKQKYGMSPKEYRKISKL